MTERRNLLTLAALGTLLAGSGQAQSNRSADLASVSTVHDLANLVPGGMSIALVAGYHVPADGGGGIFVWQADAQATPDGGLVIGRSSHAQPGRWLRLHDGAIDVRMFGARGDGKTDDTTAIQAAMDAAAGAEVRIPAGMWLITRTLRFRCPAERNVPGLKLIGDGVLKTTLDCQQPEGPALSIEQEASYKFSKYGVLRDLDISGVNAPRGREQHGIVISGAWLYRFERVEIHHFRGNGLMVPFVLDRGVRYSDVEVVAGSNMVRRKEGGFGGRVLPAETITGDGIEPETFVEDIIDDWTLRLTRAASRDGQVMLNTYGKNTDGMQTILSAQDCRFGWNDGWGIYNDAGIGLILTLRRCEMSSNGRGGIRTGGYLDAEGGSVMSNGTPDGKGIGILIEGENKRGGALTRLEAIEIDGNSELNLWLRRAHYARVSRCRFNAHDVEKIGRQFPPINIRLGDADGSIVHTIEFDQVMIRTDGRNPWPHVGFEIPDGGIVDNVVAKGTRFWGGWSDARDVKYRIGKLYDPAALLRFEEEDGRPAASLAVPAVFVAQLEATPGALLLSAGASSILHFTSARTNLTRPATVWPMTKIAELSTITGSADVTVDSLAQSRLGTGMPLLIVGDSAAPAAPGTTQIAKIARVTASGMLRLDSPAAESRRTTAVAGGVACPYTGYFTLEVVVDVLGFDKAQPLSLTLLAAGKPWRMETSLVHGLAPYETLRLSVVDHWPAGTAFHVVLTNGSTSAVSLRRAAVMLRLLT